MGHDSVEPSAPVEQPTSSSTPCAPPMPKKNAPSHSLSLACHTEAGQVSYNESKEIMFLAHLKGCEVDVEASRAPASLSAVIDRSGSMSGGKLELVKSSMRFVVSQLKETDEFGIISYDDTVRQELPLTKMTSAGKAKARHAIDSIVTGGSTNLSGGLFAGMDQQAGVTFDASLSRPQSGLKRLLSSSVSFMSSALRFGSKTNSGDMSRTVWLFTDGLANAGIQQPNELVKATQDRLGGRSTTVYTFGFGADHDASLLRRVAEAGHGMYYYIENQQKIEESFADCLGGLLSVVARDITVELTVPTRYKILQSMTWYKHQAISDTQYRFNIPDLYAEEEKDIIVMVRVPNDVPVANNVHSGTWTVTYTNTLADAKDVQTADHFIDRPEEATATPVPEIIDIQRNRLQCAKAMEEAKQLADSSRLTEARAKLTECITNIKGSNTSADKKCTDIVCDLEDAMNRMQEQNQYFSCGQQMMECTAQAHKAQRSTVSTACYSTNAKAKMKSLI